ncbi:2-acylglycerol O-acyltransferase 1-like isoform X2 [Anoplophora glabripennis]|uniref:2-acylglycerol O-acyltransferase 1-like isoform X2 n=1 Tax=Anoplophora glabripennis TaxID=217634 RepID=UPI000873CF64|nr:2-acylglycerol O-acyltransferase 1-like isoform X2 [Anoplophora glabripennis]
MLYLLHKYKKLFVGNTYQFLFVHLCEVKGSKKYSTIRMELLGIKFAPLNVPLERRLQTLAAAAWLVTFTVGGIIGTFLALYLVLCTRLRWVVLPYLIWVYFIDRHAAETGGRISPWARSWKWWKYLKDYFPLQCVKSDGAILDPNKNYLFGCFPHGVMPSGIFSLLNTNYGGFDEYFPHHERYLVTLSEQFMLPFSRELMLSLGGVASSVKSIEYILGKPGGGNVLGITVGGAKESLNSKPGIYRIVLRRRKGFVKLALRNGARLVPVFSFGQNDLFDQLDGPRLRRFQEALRKWIVIAPIIPIGRGFFQYSFGLIPRRHPVVTVGKPIEMPKIEKPTQEDIDKYHTIFMEKLIELFEENKHKYLEEPESKKLTID